MTLMVNEERRKSLRLRTEAEALIGGFVESLPDSSPTNQDW